MDCRAGWAFQFLTHTLGFETSTTITQWTLSISNALNQLEFLQMDAAIRRFQSLELNLVSRFKTLSEFLHWTAFSESHQPIWKENLNMPSSSDLD